MRFTFFDYKVFCYDFNLKPCRAKNLWFFTQLWLGHQEVLKEIKPDYEYKY